LLACFRSVRTASFHINNYRIIMLCVIWWFRQPPTATSTLQIPSQQATVQSDFLAASYLCISSVGPCICRNTPRCVAMYIRHSNVTSAMADKCNGIVGYCVLRLGVTQTSSAPTHHCLVHCTLGEIHSAIMSRLNLGNEDTELQLRSRRRRHHTQHNTIKAPLAD